MIRSILFALSLLCGFTAVQAATTTTSSSPTAAPAASDDDEGFSATLSETEVSQYYFRGLRLGGNALQADADLSYGSFDLDLWQSAPLRNQDKIPGQSDPEFVITPTYTQQVVKDILSIPVGLIIYDYPRAPLNQGFYRSTYEPFLGVTYITSFGISLTPKAYYDLIMRGPTYELSAAYTVPLAVIGTELDLAANAGTYVWHQGISTPSNQPPIKSAGSYWLAGVTIPIKLTKSWAINLGYSVTQGFDTYNQRAGYRRESLDDAIQGFTTVALALTF